MSNREKPNLLPAVSARSMRLQGRSYFVDASGQRLPSISTILNTTKPLAAREALKRWRQQVGPEAAQQISTQASRRGTLTHKHLRHYLLGESLECPEAVRPYWDSLASVLVQVNDIRLVEGPVFHYDLGYAGRVDCVASYQGIPCILDWKTSDRPKGQVERLYDNPLQLAAYCGAVNHVYADHDVHITDAALIVAVPEQEAEVFYFDAETLRDYWHQWQERVDEFYRR